MTSPAETLDIAKAALASGVRILPRETYERVREVSQTALEVIDICAAHVAANPDVVRQAFGEEPLAQLVRGAVRCPREPIGRFDIFLDEAGRTRFLEYNAGTVGGAFIPLRAAHKYLDSDEGRRAAAALDFDLIATDELFVGSLLDGRPRVTDPETPHLGMLLPSALVLPGPLEDEILTMMRLYDKRGGEARIVRMNELEVREEGVFASGWPVHTILPLEWAAMLAEGPSDHPVFTQELIGQTWIAGTLPTAVFRGGKYLFAVITDPELGAPLTPEQRRFVAEHFPMTRLLPMNDVPEARARPVLDWALQNKDDLVLKPTLGLGGRGVVAGWTIDADEWAARVAEARQTPHVLQERVIPRAEPDVPDGVWADLGAFVWSDRKVRGVQSRLSGTWLLNMAGGGWPYPVVIA